MYIIEQLQDPISTTMTFHTSLVWHRNSKQQTCLHGTLYQGEGKYVRTHCPDTSAAGQTGASVLEGGWSRHVGSSHSVFLAPGAFLISAEMWAAPSAWAALMEELQRGGSSSINVRALQGLQRARLAHRPAAAPTFAGRSTLTQLQLRQTDICAMLEPSYKLSMRTISLNPGAWREASSYKGLGDTCPHPHLCWVINTSPKGSSLFTGDPGASPPPDFLQRQLSASWQPCSNYNHSLPQNVCSPSTVNGRMGLNSKQNSTTFWTVWWVRAQSVESHGWCAISTPSGTTVWPWPGSSPSEP